MKETKRGGYAPKEEAGIYEICLRAACGKKNDQRFEKEKEKQKGRKVI